MWIVKLVHCPHTFPWSDDFFPRKFHYKKDAKALALEVATNGGEAYITKVSKEK